MSRRAGAILALAGGAVAIALAVHVFVVDFPRGFAVLACILGAIGTAWLALLRRGSARLLPAALTLALLVAAGVLMANGHNGILLAAIVVTFAVGVAGARVGFRPERSLPPAPAPRHPVLFVNPRSGEGRAARAGLVGEAGKRGIETVELGSGEDLEQLVRAAVERGADGLAMAGGDGSQALVAAIAAEHDLPYACIPSGTRNHFALDLGSDTARWRELTAPELEIDADAPVPLGIDGEAITLQPPLRFRIRPGALRVRIAHSHPGASPSAEIPKGPLSALKKLLRIATAAGY